jgi:hypothetical protein
MRLHRAPIAVLIALATIVSGAVTTIAAANAGPAANACGLVTAAEASAAMRVTSLPGKARATKRGSSCRYYSPDHKMNVFVQTAEAGDMIGAAQLGGKAVPGVGDKAIWSSGSLFVQKGGKVVQVGLYLSAASMEKMDAAIVPLGRAAAGRM